MTVPTTFEVLDMLDADPALSISEGIATDGRYVYVTPHNEFIVAKIDARSFEVVATLDLSDADPTFTGMSDSFVVGGYLYILPHFTSDGPFYQTKVVRVDLANFTAGGVDSLHVIDNPGNLNTPRDGFTDGVHGYINVRTLNAISVVRFGLGENFNAGSVSISTLTATSGADGAYLIKAGNFLCCDAVNVYGIARAAVVIGPPVKADLWLVAIPIADFQASAAVFTRITTSLFVGPVVPDVPYQLVDDGENLWTFSVPMASGPTYLAPLKIPKANPSATVITVPPIGQKAGTSMIASGQAVYDGWRYAYSCSGTEVLLAQLDTHNPGVVAYIDLTPYTANQLWGVELAGDWVYAVSFIGGGGKCVRFKRMIPPVPSELATISSSGIGLTKTIERIG